MKHPEEPITPKQIEDLLQISKVQLHHWRKLLGLKPLQPSYGKGLTTLYSRENLFVLLLLQRLFQKFRFTLPAAVAIVQRLLREDGLERLLTLPAVTVTTAANFEPQSLQPKRQYGVSALHRLQRRKDRSPNAGSITIPLTDLQEVATNVAVN